MESLIFAVTFISFLIPIVNTVVNPFPFQKEAAIDAVDRGWSDTLILVTRSCPYLTLYTQFWIIVALYYMTPTTMFIAQTLSWFVFCVYHGINYIDKKHLAYHSEEFVKKVVSWKPPKWPLVIVWFGLHWQHTIFPFYLHYLTYKYDIDYTNSFYAVMCSFGVMAFYLVWHTFCWKVQGIAAYPFLNRLRQISHEISFYCAAFTLVVVVNCIVASMWRELIFYMVGILHMIAVNHVLIKTL
jgi:hypothetical protein